jgi:hypothetical protein
MWAPMLSRLSSPLPSLRLSPFNPRLPFPMSSFPPSLRLLPAASSTFIVSRFISLRLSRFVKLCFGITLLRISCLCLRCFGLRFGLESLLSLEVQRLDITIFEF